MSTEDEVTRQTNGGRHRAYDPRVQEHHEEIYGIPGLPQTGLKAIAYNTAKEVHAISVAQNWLMAMYLVQLGLLGWVGWTVHELGYTLHEVLRVLPKLH